MIIYVVNYGDSVYSIASKFKMSPMKIIEDNDIKNPASLVMGQSLVINNDLKTLVYYVKSGDTLYNIAKNLNTDINSILSYNPNILPPYKLQIGQKILIGANENTLPTFDVNGYVYDTTTVDSIKKSLRGLTYLSIFSYSIDDNYTLIPIDDASLITVAKENKVAPIMVVTNTNKRGSFSTEIGSEILNNEIVQNKLITNIVQTLKRNGYYGLNIDFEYLKPEDKNAYTSFINILAQRLEIEGDFIFSVALAPKTSSDQKGLLYEAHDYNAIGKNVDYVVLMTYEWGYTYGEPMPVAPINEVKKVVDYALTQIPKEKIMLGVPNYGYDFTLPYKKGVAAKTILNNKATQYALDKKASIKYDLITETPYFNYYDENKQEHVVYFEDPRSIQAKINLVKDYNLKGISIWTVSSHYKQLFSVIDGNFKVNKII